MKNTIIDYIDINNPINLENSSKVTEIRTYTWNTTTDYTIIRNFSDEEINIFVNDTVLNDQIQIKQNNLQEKEEELDRKQLNILDGVKLMKKIINTDITHF